MNIIPPSPTGDAAHTQSPPSACWRDSVVTGLLYYYLTSLVAILGTFLGSDYFAPPNATEPRKHDFLRSVTNWDGQFYKTIMLQGYTFDPQKQSNVAFFPAYPLLGRLVMALTNVQPETALMIVSHLALVAAFVVLAAYVHHRFSDTLPQFLPCVLLAFGLFPTTFYCRMAYSESLFLLSSILVLYAIERRWPVLAIAGIVAFAGATRLVGVALVVPLVLHMWHRWPRLQHFIPRAIVYSPLACSGILAFMAYQFAAFGEPFAFVKTQDHWRIRPPMPFMDKLISLATLEPVWSVMDSRSPCCWHRHGSDENPLFSLHLANPGYFLFAAALIILGGSKHWLSSYELWLAIGLLLIPYLTRSHEMCMMSMGRFASVVFPIYLVLGQLLSRLPPGITTAFLGISSVFLASYAALFASGYPLF